jgi:hypothetical protein
MQDPPVGRILKGAVRPNRTTGPMQTVFTTRGLKGSVGSAKPRAAMANHFFVSWLGTSTLDFGKGFQQQAWLGIPQWIFSVDILS